MLVDENKLLKLLVKSRDAENKQLKRSEEVKKARKPCQQACASVAQHASGLP